MSVWEALMAEHAVSIKEECMQLYMACINTDNGCTVLMVFLQKCIKVTEIVFIYFFSTPKGILKAIVLYIIVLLSSLYHLSWVKQNGIL